jgi:micrococcal nuclease
MICAILMIASTSTLAFRLAASLALMTALVASTPFRQLEPDVIRPRVQPVQEAAAHRQMVPAELIRIIDGDTVEVRALIWLDQHVVTRVRLRGIDAPERDIRCPEENRRAEAAAAALGSLVAGRGLFLTDITRDKYGGRVVARVLAGPQGDVGAALLSQGHARPYERGRRERRCA